MSIDIKNQPGVIKIAGKNYAVGMMWFVSSEEAEDKVRTDRVTKLGGDYFVNRQATTPQEGIGWLNKGHRNNMISAAAIISSNLIGQWHGVFETDQGWWYVEVLADSLAPYGDILFSSEEQAYNYFIERHEMNTWAHTYAPEKWSMPFSTKQLDLVNALKYKGEEAEPVLKPVNLTAFFGSKSLTFIAVLTILGIMGSIAGFMAWPIIKDTFFYTPPVIVEPIARPKIEKPILPKEPDIEEVELVPASTIIELCGTYGSQMVTPVAGWEIMNLQCSQTGASVEWKQDTGKVNDFKEVAEGFNPQTRVVYRNEVVTASQAYPVLSKSKITTFLKESNAVLLLERILTPLGNVQIQTVKPTPPEVSTRGRRSSQNKQNSKKIRPYINITMTSTSSPVDTSGVWDLQGMDLISLRWDISSSIWTYRAKMILDE